MVKETINLVSAHVYTEFFALGVNYLGVIYREEGWQPLSCNLLMNSMRTNAFPPMLFAFASSKSQLS